MTLSLIWINYTTRGLFLIVNLNNLLTSMRPCQLNRLCANDEGVELILETSPVRVNLFTFRLKQNIGAVEPRSSALNELHFDCKMRYLRVRSDRVLPNVLGTSRSF